jgi:hypothetical protein
MLLDESNINVLKKYNNNQLVITYQINTNQKVKRSAPGGEGLVLDHFSVEATKHYLNAFAKTVSSKTGIRSFFNDSFEVYGASWTKSLYKTFKELKGYDLRLYSMELAGHGENELIKRIKFDYRDVLGKMLYKNFTQTWHNWTKTNRAMTRNQAHGSPANIIDLYALVDIPEMETFHAEYFPFLENRITNNYSKHTESNPLFKKFASSASHVQAKSLVSCETFTWLNEHYRTPLYQCKPEIDELFVKGANHLVYHGTCYSPKEAKWPGWSFYASVHMNPSNPQWEHIEAMNKYVTRCQSILQAGGHTNDFLVLWSPDDYFHDKEHLQKMMTLHNSEKWVGMKSIYKILDQGYQFDFVTDKMIQEQMSYQKACLKTFDKVDYKTIVIPFNQFLNYESFNKLFALAKAGANIVFEKQPQQVSGFSKFQEKEHKMLMAWQNLKFKKSNDFSCADIGRGKIYCGTIPKILEAQNIYPETHLKNKIKSISRKIGDNYYYFLANHEKQEFVGELSFKHGSRNAYLLNPMNGEVFELSNNERGGRVIVDLTIKAGESFFVMFTNSEKKASKFEKVKKCSSKILGSEWILFPKQILYGGFKETKLKTPKFWSLLNIEGASFTVGTCVYQTKFSHKNENGKKYILQLPNVQASARVILNGKDCGCLWSFPFELDVTKHLVSGQNQLSIEVSSHGANGIKHLDQNHIEWKIFKNSNVVNLNYRKFDASNWELMDCGMHGAVKLRIEN